VTNFGVDHIDHIALTVVDIEATLEWYEKVLGAERLHYELFRTGAIPVALLQVGGARLSVHLASAPAAPHARVPTPGSADLCFRWRGPIESAVAAIESAGVEVIEGPVPRPANNGEMGQSVYCIDPDGNLVELLSLHSEDPSAL
jgi:catechol 2,3-dioxygenase-like lactoylglutathione lyase family enzyme